MAGTIIPLWGARNFDYSGLAQGTEVTMALRLVQDLSRYRSVQLLLRLHAVNITGAATLDFVLFNAAPSWEDPATTFVDTSTELRLSVAGATAGTLRWGMWDFDAFGEALQVVANATQPAGSTQTIEARVSAALLVRR